MAAKYRVAFYYVCYVLFFSSLAFAEKPEVKHRRYDQGPLAVSEFRTDSPDAIRGRAYTMTQVLYEYKAVEKQVARNQYEAQLRSLDAFAVFVPKKSWWSSRNNPSLLDHEQGHFDIAEITARQMELAFRKAIKAGKAIKGTGRTRKRATQNLMSRLREAIDAANKQAEEENRNYDNQTHHGVRTSRQSEYRRIQKLTLDKLQRELSGTKKRAAEKEPIKVVRDRLQR